MRHGIVKVGPRNIHAAIRTDKGDLVWECNHIHAFQDTALNCADQEMAKRGMIDTGLVTPRGTGIVDRKPTLDEL